MRLAKPYNPLPGQSAFHASGALAKYYCGSLGAGKSSALCVEGIALSVEYPGNIGLLARDTLPQLTSTTLARFLDYLPRDLLLEHYKKDRKLVIRSTGEVPSIVYYGPLDEIDRYKSLDVGWWAVDEADKMTEDMFHILIGRLRHPGARLSAMLASNPTTTQHWLYKRFFESTDPDFQLFRAKTKENSANLPPGYVERLMKAYPVDWQKRYVDGEPGTIMEGTAVFPDFREDLHVRSVFHKPGRKILRGWDFGYHFPCVVWAEFDELGRFLILDAVFGNDEDLLPFAKRVVQQTSLAFPQAEVEDYCDPAGMQKKDTGKSSIQTLNQDLRIFPRYRWSKVEERASEIRRLLREIIHREPAFQIHPSIRRGIDSLIGYHYSKNKEGFAMPDPHKDDVHDHFIDTIGYILANTSLIQPNLQREPDAPIVEPSYFKSRLRRGHGR